MHPQRVYPNLPGNLKHSRVYIATATYLVLREAELLDEGKGVATSEVQADGVDGQSRRPLVRLGPDVLEESHQVHVHRRGEHRARLSWTRQGREKNREEEEG